MPLGQLLFGFHGRIGRLVYWVASLIVCAAAFLLAFVLSVWFPADANGERDAAAILPIVILQLPFCWANLAIQTKRWHDRNRSGWWALIHLVPLLGSIFALVECGFLAGNPSSNRFGPSPQEIRASEDTEAMRAALRTPEVEAAPASAGVSPALLAGVFLAGVGFAIGLAHFTSDDPEPTPSAVAPQPAAPTPSPAVPALVGRVNDYADLLTPTQEAELAALYQSLEREIGCEIALLTIDDLHGESIEDYSRAVVDAWGLGRRGIEDGLLITVARRERKVRIAVGPGLESIVPDDAAETIIQRMVPSFARDDYFQGLEDGSREIVRMIHAQPELVGHEDER
jgi:uncharacterized membrane protein YhaH (DUF805 family)